MVKNLICTRCGHVFAKTAKQRDLTNHLNRKNPCKPKVQELTPEPEPEVIHEPEPTPENKFNEIEFFKALGIWKYAKSKEFKSQYRENDDIIPTYTEPPLEDITNYE